MINPVAANPETASVSAQQRPWVLSMRWRELLFMHWPLPPSLLKPLLPPGVTLETFGGSAWLAVVPFRMAQVRPRLLPSVPGMSSFPELNVRTYVQVQGRPGVWFFSLEARNPVAVWIARRGFGLPYYRAQMRVFRRGDTTSFYSARRHRGASPAYFSGHYRPRIGETGDETSDSDLTRFLTARSCLYSTDRVGRVLRADIFHAPWALSAAEAELERPPSEMTAQLGFALPDTPPLLHYAHRLEVVAWPPVRVA